MRTVVYAAILLGWCAAGLADEPVAESPPQQARALALEFIGLLKPQMKQAMTEGGPANAIRVCADVAPGIADTLGAQSGWNIKRVSLRPRNASRAVPDAWERTVLLKFNQRQAAGEDPADISFGEVVGGQYRYMQAQGVESVCLVCHGKGVADAVQEVLDQYYPDDVATGYSLGQVRGAISLAKPL